MPRPDAMVPREPPRATRPPANVALPRARPALPALLPGADRAGNAAADVPPVQSRRTELATCNRPYRRFMGAAVRDMTVPPWCRERLPEGEGARAEAAGPDPIREAGGVTLSRAWAGMRSLRLRGLRRSGRSR